MLEHVTFGLAYGAYVLLCAQGVLHLRGSGPRWLSLLLAATATTHVALVWHNAFAWSLTYAWSENPAAFLIFHTALALIISAALSPAPWSARCLWLAWPIVTVGALGAVLRREVVAHFFWPVVAACGITLIVGAGLVARRRS